MTTTAAGETRFRTASTTPEQILAQMNAEQLREQLRAVQSVTEAALSRLALPELLDELLTRLRDNLRVDTATILLHSEDGRSLRVRASKGLEEEVEQRVSVPIGKGIAGAVAVRREAVIVDDVASSGVVSPLLRRLSSMMAAPLLAEGELLGVLHVGSFSPRRFTDSELYLLDVVASRAAPAVRNALTQSLLARATGERTSAEAALARSEARYTSFLASNPNPVFALDHQGRFTMVNAAACAACGYSEEELVGSPFVPLIVEELRKETMHAIAVARSGQPQLFETTIVAGTGQHRHLRVTAIPAYEKGAVSGVFGVAQDVTEQRLARAALLASEARLDALLNQRVAGIAEVDLTGRFVLVNDRFCEIVGRTRDELLRLRMQEVTHKDDLPGNAALFRDLVGGGSDFAIEKRYLRPDGSTVWVHNSVLGVRDRDGALAYVVAVVQDITDRKRAEAERARAVARLELIASAGRELASSLDLARTLNAIAHLAVPDVADWAFVHLLQPDGSIELLAVGHSDAAMEEAARDVLRRYPIDPAAPFGTGRVIRTGRREISPEITGESLRAVARDEEHLSLLERAGFRSHASAPLIAHGRVVGALTLAQAHSGRRFEDEDLLLIEELALRAAVSIDNARLYEEAREEIRRREEVEVLLREHTGRLEALTLELEEAAERALERAREAESARREAEQASRAKDEFLSAMSHELRTPLNAIAGYVDLIEVGIYGPVTTEQRQALERIRRSGNHLLLLINDVLHFVELQARQLEFTVADISVDEILERVAEVVEPQALQRGITLSVEPVDPEITVHADPDRIRQILLNLVDNALKFTGAGGAVTLRARVGDEQVRIEVQDTGRGIPSERLEAIFDAFVQLERHRHDTSQQGVGLGLTISRDLAHGMGGSLSVESQEGIGSTFTLTLPRSAPAER